MDQLSCAHADNSFRKVEVEIMVDMDGFMISLQIIEHRRPTL